MKKRFEETLAGLQADINTKINARQGVQDELDALIAAKEKPSMPAEVDKSSPSKPFGSSSTNGTPAGATDGEAERDNFTKEAGGEASGTREASFDDDDDDDLFGDGGDDEDGDGGDEAVVGTAEGGTPVDAEEMDVEGTSFEEGGEEEIDAEMAAMLDAELGNTGEEAQENLEPALGEDSAAELAQMQFDDSANIDSEGLDQLMQQNEEIAREESAASGGFGVEGGVGMRRLATGVMEDDDDADSDTSGSSD